MSRSLSFVYERIALLSYVTISSALTILFPILDVFVQRKYIWEYVILILGYLLFFLAPLLFTAEYLRSKIRFTQPPSSKYINLQVILFCCALLTFAALFMYVTIKGGLFFRRIGFSGLVERSIALPIYDLVIHRTFMEVATTLFCTAIALAIASPLLRSVRLLLIGVFFLVFGSYFSFVLLNNRFQSAILFLEMLIALLYFVNSNKEKRRTILVGAVTLISIVGLYSFRITNNIRDQIYIFECIDVTAINPFQSYLDIFARAKSINGRCDGIKVRMGENMLERSARLENAAPPHTSYSTMVDKQTAIERPAASDKPATSDKQISLETKEMLKEELERPWAQRLDGIKLLAEITKPAFEQGFGWGSFWYKPFALYIYYFTDRDKYFEIKRNLKTNPKVYMAKAYLHKEIDDMPSIILTDLYGNFSFLGFVLGGVFMGTLLAFVDGCLRRSLSIGPIVFAFFLLEKSLYAEKEFLIFFMDIIKFSPVPLLVAFLLQGIPIRRMT